MKVFGVLILLLLLVTTSACVSSNAAGAGSRASAGEGEGAGRDESPKITLREARQFQNNVLLELATYVPPESVVGGMDAPIPQMSGMTCDWTKYGNDSAAEAGVLLPGGYDIAVSADVDLDQLLEQIRVDYLEKEWEVGQDKSGEDKRVNLVSPEGYEFFLTALSKKDSSQKLMMSSFSPCIQAPEGFNLFDEY